MSELHFTQSEMEARCCNGHPRVQNAAQGLCVHSSHEELVTALVWHKCYRRFCDINSSLLPCFYSVLAAFFLLRHRKTMLPVNNVSTANGKEA